MSNDLTEFNSSSGHVYSKSESEIMISHMDRYDTIEEWEKYFSKFYQDEEYKQFLLDYAEKRNSKGYGNKSFRWFGCILYEDDPQHMDLFRWFMNDYIVGAYSVMAVCHDLDTTEDGELKKPHYHVLFKMPKQYSVKSVLKFFGGRLNHVQPENDIMSACLYLLHLTPEACLDEHKHIYGLDEVLGNIGVYNQIIQNANSVYNQALVCFLRRGMSILDILESDDVSNGLKNYIIKHMAIASALERSAHMSYVKNRQEI